MATNLEAIVDADDYRIFNDKIGIAQSKGVEIPFCRKFGREPIK